jgi:hypothetical protein
MLKTKNTPTNQGLELAGTPYDPSGIPGTVKLLKLYQVDDLADFCQFETFL